MKSTDARLHALAARTRLLPRDDRSVAVRGRDGAADRTARGGIERPRHVEELAVASDPREARSERDEKHGAHPHRRVGLREIRVEHDDAGGLAAVRVPQLRVQLVRVLPDDQELPAAEGYARREQRIL